MLVNGRGEPWLSEKGERILVPALPLMLRGEDSADMPLTYKEVAKRAGISTSGVKRAVKAGKASRHRTASGNVRCASS